MFSGKIRRLNLCFKQNKITSQFSRFFSQTSDLDGCLSGVNVLDLSRILAAPYCSMMLADLGAQVIKVEKLEKGDETRSWGPPWVGESSAYYLAINRNKKSIAVDFKKAKGLQIIKELAKKSDILLENYKPAKLEQIGLGYNDICKINPNIIYCSVSGFGSSGPYSERAGYDVIAASIGGLLAITGSENGEPCKVGVAVTDLTTGLHAYGAILAALNLRNQTGVGMKIDCNLLSTQIAMLINAAIGYLNASHKQPRRGTAHDNVVPYQSFLCKDNQYLTICCGSDKMFHTICELIFDSQQAKTMINNVQFKDNSNRNLNRQILIPIMAEALKKKSLQEWLQVFEGSGVSYGPVNELDQVFNDPQVIHNQSVFQLNHKKLGPIKLLSPPVEYHTTNSSTRVIRSTMTPPPTLGEHTMEVLKNFLNYDQNTINQLVREKVIFCEES